jgi:hypothetical protein
MVKAAWIKTNSGKLSLFFGRREMLFFGVEAAFLSGLVLDSLGYLDCALCDIMLAYSNVIFGLF